MTKTHLETSWLGMVQAFETYKTDHKTLPALIDANYIWVVYKRANARYKGPNASMPKPWDEETEKSIDLICARA